VAVKILSFHPINFQILHKCVFPQANCSCISVYCTYDAACMNVQAQIWRGRASFLKSTLKTIFEHWQIKHWRLQGFCEVIETHIWPEFWMRVCRLHWIWSRWQMTLTNQYFLVNQNNQMTLMNCFLCSESKIYNVTSVSWFSNYSLSWLFKCIVPKRQITSFKAWNIDLYHNLHIKQRDASF